MDIHEENKQFGYFGVVQVDTNNSNGEPKPFWSYAGPFLLGAASHIVGGLLLLGLIQSWKKREKRKRTRVK